MTHCLLCNSLKVTFSGRSSLGVEAIFDTIECKDCESYSFYPLPLPHQLSQYYSANYYDGFERNRQESRGRIFAEKLNGISRTGNFLDVGCATGFFINGIRAHSNWNVYGIDFGKDSVEYARTSLQLDVKQGDLCEAGYPEGFFDYIHINNVLEHVPNPMQILLECSKILKKGGTLYLSVPNGRNDVLESLEYYRETQTPAYSVHGHIFFFSPQSLLKMLNSSGFAIESESTFHFKTGLRNLNILKKKMNWKSKYLPRRNKIDDTDNILQPTNLKQGIRVIEGKSRPYLIEKMNFMLKNLCKVPGLNKFGLDYLIIARKL